MTQAEKTTSTPLDPPRPLVAAAGATVTAPPPEPWDSPGSLRQLAAAHGLQVDAPDAKGAAVRRLIAAVAGLDQRALGKVAELAAAMEPARQDDIELLVLAADLQAAEADYAAACTVADNEAGIDAASQRIDGVLARMTRTPAVGLHGIAAKAGRLIFAVCEAGGLMDGEVELAASLGADLARLTPGVAPALPRASMATVTSGA